MPKKKVQKTTASRSTKAEKDFFFFVVISVFATLTIFAVSYVSSSTKAAQANQNVKFIDVAPLYVR